MFDGLDISKIPTQVPEVIRKVLSGQVPSPEEFVQQHLAGLGGPEAAILLLVGLVFLIYGWQAFRLLIIANGAFFGGLGGAYLASTYVGRDMALFGLLAGGILLAVLVVPLIRYAVGLGGGVAGSYLGYYAWPNLAAAFHHPEWGQYAWIGALVGMAALSLLCLMTFRQIVMAITSVEGAMLAVSGGLALCLRNPSMAEGVRSALIEKRFLLPLLFTVPSVIGFAVQYNVSRRPPRQKSEGGSSQGKAKRAAA